MSSDIPKLFKNHNQTCEMLKNLVRETLVALSDIGPDMKISQEIEGIIIESNIDQIKQEIGKRPLIVIGGQTSHAKALLINHLLDDKLPARYTSHWRPVYLKYGAITSVRTTWNFEFEVVDDVTEYQPRFIQEPFIDIEIDDLDPVDDQTDDDPWSYSVEIEIPHQFLKDDVKILILPEINVRPDCRLMNGLDVHLKDYTPVILFAIYEDYVSTQSMQYVHKIVKEYPVPFLFISVADNDETSATDSLTESTQHSLESKNDIIVKKIKSDLLRVVHVIDADSIDTDELLRRTTDDLSVSINTITSFANFKKDFVTFVDDIIKLHSLNLARKLSHIHNKCVKRFILSAFDMARQIQITPQRMYYARAEEQRLYLELKVYADDQQNCLTSIITSVLHEMKTNIQEFLTEFDETYNSSTDRVQTAREAKLKIQDLILQRLRNKVAQRLSNSIACLQECFTGTLERCLENIEKSCDGLENNALASNALKQIITAAYNIDIRATTSFSVIHIFMDHCKKLFLDYILPVSGRWPLSDRSGPPNLEAKIHYISTIMNRLSPSKLAKTISSQFRDQIKSSHDAFLLAVRLLDNQLSGKLEQTEEQRVLIRKKHAPKFARLALESTSLYDCIIYGMPKQYAEVGRGQYGVVYSCEPWGGIETCAFKSVVPPDDRHWNDLAMEFYYTRSIPEHPRILKLRGSVIDYTYGGGSSPAVLLIMERMFRDLHCGLRQGLDWLLRLQIAIDVVAGLRYLHSQGLVHRDIKLKNVLLDQNNRAKLTDFGFCIPEAMISGSIVGTPVHMAPELLLGRYDSSVDVYAFGILFWYICSGQVKLPNRFDQFQNKEQLWNNVRRGIRPEYLTQFSKPCWKLMEKCWAGEPSDRPLLGDVESQLHAIFTSCKDNINSNE